MIDMEKEKEFENMREPLRVKFKALFSQKSFTLFLLFLLAFVMFPSCESRKTIVNGLEEKEANEIIVYLANKNIEAVKVPAKEAAGAGGGSKVVLYDIAVDSSKAIEAMGVLNAAGLPRRRPQNLLQLFPAGGLVPSEMQEKIRYQAGLAEQIASTIRKIDGILDAEVQLSFPEEDPLNPNAPKGHVTASVYVRHNGVLDDPNSHLITKIKRLVASSVNGLNFDNVTVIPDRARFSESSDLMSQGRKTAEEMSYVKVWTIIIAKDSLVRFQTIFFTFCLLILILILYNLWLSWKLYPILRKRGGIKQLFHLAPLPDHAETEAPKDQEAVKKTDETKPKDDQKGPKVQENVENP